MMPMRLRNYNAMSAEAQIQAQVLLRCSSGPVRLFRNNVGTGWAGQAMRITAANRFTIGQTLQPGDVVVRQGRPLHAGLCVGSGDLIGYSSVTITPDMVGQQVAVFASVEVKAPRGRVSPEQAAFAEHIQRAGGRAGIARSVADAEAILKASTAAPSER
jgi:hypothetical protein